MAAVDVRNATSAVASLSRLSPSRIETMRRGMPDPARDGRGRHRVGRRHDRAERQRRRERDAGHDPQATRPTNSVVKTTAPTARMPMAWRLARTSTRDVRIAAA